jgi:hypothetical protein
MCVETSKKINQRCDRAGPAGLMARSQARTVIPVEVLKEQNEILPVGIALEFLRVSVYRPSSCLIPQENSFKTNRKVLGYLEQIHEFARSGRTVDLKVVPVIQIERQ